jgi:hypothetical protein
MDGTVGYHIKQNQPDTERQLSYVFLYVETKKIDTRILNINRDGKCARVWASVEDGLLDKINVFSMHI